MATSSLRKHLPSLIIAGLGIVLFSVLTFLNDRVPGSDDTIFQSLIQPFPDLVSWVAYRYETWSGRISAEAFMYIFSSSPLIFWQLVNIAMYGLFILAAFGIYRLIDQDRAPIKDRLIMALVVCLPFLLDKFVLSDGGIWITGTIVYFWPACLALVGMYPVVYYLTRNKLASWPIVIAGILALIIAITSQEQVGAFICAFLALVIGYKIIGGIQQKQIVVPRYLVVLLAISTVLLIISLAAPGNSERVELETLRWLPDLNTVAPIERLEYSYRWIIDGLVNHSGFLLPIIWTSMAILFLKKGRRGIIDQVFVYAFAIATIFLLAKGSESVSYWLNFYASWRPSIPNPYLSLNLVPWSIVLVLTVIAPLRLFPKSGLGKLTTLSIAGAFACAAIIALSPTMYASGFRTLFIPSFILMMVVVVFAIKLFQKVDYRAWILIAITSSLAASHYIYQIMRLVSE